MFLYSMVVGVLAMRRLSLGFLGLAVFAGIGLAAALTRHGATGSYAVPTIFGALAGAFALCWLVGTARQAAAARQAARTARDDGRRAPLRPDRPPPAALWPRRRGRGRRADGSPGHGQPPNRGRRRPG